MSNIFEIPLFAENLCAMAHLGALATNPNRFCILNNRGKNNNLLYPMCLDI